MFMGPKKLSIKYGWQLLSPQIPIGWWPTGHMRNQVRDGCPLEGRTWFVSPLYFTVATTLWVWATNPKSACFSYLRVHGPDPTPMNKFLTGSDLRMDWGYHIVHVHALSVKIYTKKKKWSLLFEVQQTWPNFTPEGILKKVSWGQPVPFPITFCLCAPLSHLFPAHSS